MFTGIVETTGHLIKREQRGADMRLWVGSDTLDYSDVKLGDSIAVNGVCLTLVELQGSSFAVDVSLESMQRTGLTQLNDGALVNLEKAMRLQDRLGGHLVSGHVDDVGEVLSIQEQGRSYVYRFQIPGSLMKYIVEKASICINGVSLTVNQVAGQQVSVNIIPHTMQQTNFQHLQQGDSVNIEVDMIARYLEGLRQASGDSAITADMLKRCGFSHE